MVAEHEEVPLSPSEAVPQRPSRGEGAPLGPKITADDRAGGAAVEALKASRLDFLFRSKPERPAPEPESFDLSGPPIPARPPAARQRVPNPNPSRHPIRRKASPSSLARAARPQPEPAPVEEEPRAAAILKSGVVDGMAYTLYADGSIEAKLPHGTVRFGSIAELRAHIESNS